MWTRDYEEIVAWADYCVDCPLLSMTTLSFTSKGVRVYKVYTQSGLVFKY